MLVNTLFSGVVSPFFGLNLLLYCGVFWVWGRGFAQSLNVNILVFTFGDGTRQRTAPSLPP